MADIKVNSNDWEAASEQDRSKIRNVLTRAKLLQSDDRIVPDKDVGGAPTGGGGQNDLCKAVCDVAQAAAIVECNKLDGTAKELCIAVAKAAGDVCRGKC